MAKSAIPEYQVWKAMRARCLRPSSSGFHKYGARGITICKKWDDFTVFFEDMGSRPSSIHSIDRIDNNGNYKPSNCRWAMPKQQARNKRNVPTVIWDGTTTTLVDLCDRFSISIKTVRNRLRTGWELTAALKTPASKTGHRFRPATKAYKALTSQSKSGFDPR